MTISTVALSAAVTPTVISTFISHYLHHKSRRHKPTHHISYDEALNVIREFLRYASYHTVEDIQDFTSRWVPSPHWVKLEDVIIPAEYLSSAANAIIEQLGPRGVSRVGGKEWWQWRGPSEDLSGEWIEMRSDYNERKLANAHCKRVMLYVHGGAYFFGSVDTHRYQLQRHARKLKARVFARELTLYRLAPQFPFPCGLQDCVAAYLYLLSIHDPTEIILAGDSAGGGMVVSILVTLRDRDLPLPAGAILISPWVDLTHSFPSVVKDNPGDYIPPCGFMQKPSRAWPPPNTDEVSAIVKGASERVAKGKGMDGHTPEERNKALETAVRGYTIREKDPSAREGPRNLPYPGHQHDLPPSEEPNARLKESDNLRIVLDDVVVEIKDQIQMYATNQLMSHPLVSPVLQPSLGGLPPLLILTGGGEMLRDEQIYLAHKAAHPAVYPPNDVYLNEHDPNREILHKYGPTFVQLQVWDDLCHVAPTLSFTRPAKYMFRSIAQFGAWALARAQKSEIDILDDDDVSVISSSGTDIHGSSTEDLGRKAGSDSTPLSVGKAGDPLPLFHNHMIRQRVDRRGTIYPLDPPESLEALQRTAAEVGALNPDLVRKWMGAKKRWDLKFAKDKLRVQKLRINELAGGFDGFEGETPPPSALAGRRTAFRTLPKKRARKSHLMMMWSLWGSKHDEKTLHREVRADKADETTNVGVNDGEAGAEAVVAATTSRPRRKSLLKREGAAASSADQNRSRSASRRRTVSDAGQASLTDDESPKEKAPGENGFSGNAGIVSDAMPSGVASGRPSASEEFPSSSFTLAGLDAGDSRSPRDHENASTTAVRRARGIIPPMVRGSSLRAEYRPASGSGWHAPALTITSDMGETMSVASDGFAQSIEGDREADPNASTLAVIGAAGVIGHEKAKRNADVASEVSSIDRYISNTDAYKSLNSTNGANNSRESASVISIDGADGVVSPIGDEGKGNAQSSDQGRPSMPDREEFKTAQETL